MTKKDEPYQTAHGPLPAEYWDNDQRFNDDVDTSPGSHYDQLFGPHTEYGKLAAKLKQDREPKE